MINIRIQHVMLVEREFTSDRGAMNENECPVHFLKILLIVLQLHHSTNEKCFPAKLAPLALHIVQMLKLAYLLNALLQPTLSDSAYQPHSAVDYNSVNNIFEPY